MHSTVHLLSPMQNPLPCPSNQTVAWLLGLSGVHAGEDFRITVGEMYVGSGWDSSLVLTIPEVSRRHGKFTSARGICLLEDNGSATGVFVNGEKISEPRPLNHGDRVRMGVGEFLFFNAEVNEMDGRRSLETFKDFRACSNATAGWLVCTTGDLAGLDFRLRPGPNKVGSLPGLDVTLPDLNLNSIHFTLDCSLQRFYLRPGFASLRVMRAGVEVDSSVLTDGDSLEIGSLRMILRVV